MRRRELRRNLLCVSGRDTERSKPRPAKPPPDSRYGGKQAEGLSALRPAAPKRAVALQLEPAALWEAADSDDDDDTDNAPGPPRKAGRGRGARKAKEHEAFWAHCERLSSLLVAEWEAELAVAEARLREWPLQRLQREGLVLCGLAYAREPDLHANVVLRFALHAAALLPYTALGAGDCVQLTRGASASGGSALSQRPPSLVPSSPASSTVHLLSDDSVTAVVLERTQTLIKVALTDTAAELMESQPSTGWRMDVCANAVSHERMLSAVASFGAPRGDSRVAASFSPLQRALMGDGAVAAAPPPWLTGAEGPQRRRQAEGCAVTAAEDARLNPSQAAAIRAALQRTLTHVQGPPGTGKTATLVAFAAAAVRAHPRSASPRGPILLACAPSNLSADALAEGIDGATPASCVVVRVGSSVRVSPRLARLSLAYRVASHPRGIEAASLRAAARDAETPSGAAALRAASRDAHAAAIADVLAASTVVVSTCTGAGDPCLSATRFPWLVVDEAAQATEPACLVPLALADACLLVGDTAQLPPTVLSGGAGGNALSVSLPQRVAPFLPPMMLDTQFRSARGGGKGSGCFFAHPHFAVVLTRFTHTTQCTRRSRPSPPPPSMPRGCARRWRRRRAPPCAASRGRARPTRWRSSRCPARSRAQQAAPRCPTTRRRRRWRASWTACWKPGSLRRRLA